MDREQLSLLDDMRQTALDALLHVDAATEPDPARRRLVASVCDEPRSLRVAVGSLMLMRVLAALRGVSVAELLAVASCDPDVPETAVDGYTLLQGVLGGFLSTEGDDDLDVESPDARSGATEAVLHEVALVAGLRGINHLAVIATIRTAIVSARVTGKGETLRVLFPAVENMPQP